MEHHYSIAPITASDVFKWGGDWFYQIGNKTYRIKVF